MKIRRGFSKVSNLSICVILLLSLAEVVEREPFGFRLASDGKRVLLSLSDFGPHPIRLPGSVLAMERYLPADGPCIATVVMLPGPSPLRSGPMDECPGPPDEAGPRSSTVQRI